MRNADFFKHLLASSLCGESIKIDYHIYQEISNENTFLHHLFRRGHDCVSCKMRDRIVWASDQNPYSTIRVWQKFCTCLLI